ncbi:MULTISPECIES: MerC domain-containing protein [Novilysobacter]|uniref:MerC domain-containing protein n=1 Tax=Novilysobacter TaxID=3382699 RepID=UPI002EDACADE
MPPSQTLRTADRVGFAASFLCAVHCALLPVLLGLIPALGLKIGGWIDFDQAFVVFASLLGATTLGLGYRRHRAFHAWVLLVPGLLLVWVASFTALHDHTMTHVVMMTIGGLALAAAHLINLRLTHATRR